MSRTISLSLSLSLCLCLLLCALFCCHVESAESSYQALKRRQQEKKAQALERERQTHTHTNTHTHAHTQRFPRRAAREEAEFIAPPALSHAAVPAIAAGDGLLFAGVALVPQGALLEHGFVRVFERKLREKGLRDVRVDGVGVSVGADSDVSSLLARLRERECVPSKTVLLFDNAFLDAASAQSSSKYGNNNSNNNSSAAAVKGAVRREMERLIASFVREGVSLVVASLFLRGERRSDDDNGEDNSSLFEGWRALLRQTSAAYEGVSFLDFSAAVERHWDAHNLENSDHAVLTHDGETLNEEGHAFLAYQLLQAFGLSQKPSIDELSATDALRFEALLQSHDHAALLRSPLWENLIAIQHKKKIKELPVLKPIDGDGI